MSDHPDAKKPKTFSYFVDDAKYDSIHSTLTGAQIKAQLPNFDNSYQLFLEGHGDAADTLVGDEMSVTLEKEHGPLRFYTVPPATFG